MLQAEYTRDLTNTYMLLRETGRTSGASGIQNSYEVKMLGTNRIPGLLPVAADYINGQAVCRYTVTSLIPFDMYWKQAEVTEDSIRNFVLDLLDRLLLFEDYLLDSSHLCLEADYLYMAPEPPSLMIAYVPFHTGDLRTSLTRLFEHLLLMIGHRDRDGVILTCRILHELQESRAELMDLRAMLGHESRSASAGAPAPDAGVRYKEPVSGDESPFESGMYRPDAERPYRSDACRPETSHPYRSDVYHPEPDRLYEEPESFRTRTEQKKARRKERGTTFRLCLLASLPAAAIYVLLHMQTVLVLNSSETTGAALLVAAFLLLLIHLFRKGTKKPAADSCEPHSFSDSLSRDSLSGDSTYPAGAESPALIPEDSSRDLPEIVLSGPETLIGKQKDLTDCVIPKKSVSRVHARITRRGDICYVEDLRSKNGTIVNGRRLKPGEQIPLIEGADVSFAGCTYTFHARGEEDVPYR